MSEHWEQCANDEHARYFMNMCRCGAVLYRRDGRREVNEALIAAWAEGLRGVVANLNAGRSAYGPAVLDAAPIRPTQETDPE